MDGNPPDDPDPLASSKVKRKGWPAAALEQDKKTAFWMGGVMECFSSVLSLFNKANTAPTNGKYQIITLVFFLFFGSYLRFAFLIISGAPER